MEFGIFLSCLYGSELIQQPTSKETGFLSCLYGSEHRGEAEDDVRFFLSCLYGSEHPSMGVTTSRAFSKLPVRQ